MPKGRLKAFSVEPEVTINNQWSNRYTVIEVTGLDRPGLLYELTATLSKLSLNITSAHVATFGERVVDVFYVTDSAGRQDRLADARGRDQARAAATAVAGKQARRRPRAQRRADQPAVGGPAHSQAEQRERLVGFAAVLAYFFFAGLASASIFGFTPYW